MDVPEVHEPDSIDALTSRLSRFYDVGNSKPTRAEANTYQHDASSRRLAPTEHFNHVPDELAKYIFSFLDGFHLARAREVCHKWNSFASEEPLWKALCLEKWKSLDTDEHVWQLICRNIARDAPNRWRKIYPIVITVPLWNFHLQKTNKFICNVIAHQISSTAVGAKGIPSILIIERRFNVLHLQTFILPDAAVLYFEPETEKDRNGFNELIEHLNRRTCVGMAMEDQRRFIFIPPCDYTRTQVDYHGTSLLGVVQNSYPPLAP